MWGEFKKFAFKGNVLDLAVGVIIGAAFGKIVSSLVDDIIMPIVGLFAIGEDFSLLTYKTVKYGAFMQSIVDFFITAFAIFLFIKLITRYRKKEEAKPADPKPDLKEELLIEIRDLLKEKNRI
ncbi:large conductance mechanosensitive channel protein MscL [Mesobacillus subterraneus]|uniref:large conductance mechanosensitive channel protein MscL n=1 Tax=Mesobacillus subterraneus TaxID=285983 RepID=UPI00203C59A3|nr:large conductance mechanosensitive channel protein MscL [Mesobacillus subterraneus]MCM3665292.1 large conductance mechanosensitive channel protein MscL [Mesobacillus subterraneus]MCM3684305.1 large conductance mechanosensitive channel protein MscL [Mesobacillus subterraneus]